MNKQKEGLKHDQVIDFDFGMTDGTASNSQRFQNFPINQKVVYDHRCFPYYLIEN